MSGAGNDFIIIDNRAKIVVENHLPDFIAAICRRKWSVGADGVILVEDSDTADFKWRFFNSDGSVAEMCGNGARCVARFARENRIAGDEMTFETLAGTISAWVTGQGVKLKMTDPSAPEPDLQIELAQGPIRLGRINTGVPHAVLEVDDIQAVPVVDMGREIRHHAAFQPAGTNVNFVAACNDGTYAIRTYERGVEGETLACGTGNVAAALLMALAHDRPSPMIMVTRSGVPLTVYFKRRKGHFTDVFLEGDARIVYRAELDPGAWTV